MLSKSEAINTIEKRGPKGKRITFQIAWITANRIAWAQKKKMLAALDPSAPDHQKKLQELSRMDVGGKFISHTKCVSSSPRGMHSAKAKGHTPNPSREGKNTPLPLSRGEFKKAPNHWLNRTLNIETTPGQIRKVHKSLIMEVNNIKVQY